MKLNANVGALAFAIAIVGAGIVGISCAGADGANGEPGIAGEAGVGPAGDAGAPGQPGAAADGGGGGYKAPYNPGLDLKLTIDSAAVDAAQTATVTFLLTDANKVPLVLPITTDGRIGTLDGTTFTADQVGISFVLAWLDQNGATPGYYTPYTTRAVDGGSPKAATDTGGKFALSSKGDGYYTYTYGTKAAVGANASKTHTVGAYAVRTIPGVATPYVSNAEYNFVPAGGAVSVTREVVLRTNCNQCHGELGHHGGANNARQDIQLCVLCHNPATTDLASQNTINLGTMVHKIHSGLKLPSVTEKNLDGTPKFPYAFGKDDYSDVGYPQDLGNCAKCHGGAKDTAIWKNATLAACSSCHDRTYYTASPPATPAAGNWTFHKLGVVIDPNAPNACNTCHNPGGVADPAKYHHVTNTDVALKIISAEFTPAPNSQLKVVFDLKVTDNTVTPPVTTQGDATKLGVWSTSRTSISLILGGPTDDFLIGNTNRFTVFSGKIPAAATGGTLSLPDAVTKYYTFTTTRADFDTTLGASIIAPLRDGGLTGTWGVAMTATSQQAPRVVQNVSVAQPSYYAPNDIVYINAADNTKGKAATPVVETARCATCHEQIPGHGGSRNDVRVCQLCHVPRQDDPTKPGNLAATAGAQAVGRTVDFKVFIHDMHLGEKRDPANTAWYGNGDFTSSVKYPDKLNNCQHCHLPGTNALPQVAPTQMPTQSRINTCTTVTGTACSAFTFTSVYTAPNKAVCTSCHDSVSAQTHTTIMSINPGADAPLSATNPAGYAESCDTCHGVGRQFDVNVVHALRY